jgi:hypothetical protein
MGAELEMGGRIGREDMLNLHNELKAKVGADRVNDIALVPSKEGVRALNFSDMPAKDFQRSLASAAEKAIDKNMSMGTFDFQGDLISNNWKEHPSGKGYDPKIRKGSPDLPRALDRVSSRVSKVNARYAEERGWGKSTQGTERGEEGLEFYDPAQPRDKSGKWASGFGAGGGMSKEPRTKCGRGPCYDPAPGAVYSRVGVPGNVVPPPPPVPRLPNLTPEERAAESRFAEAYEANPDGMANLYRQSVYSMGGNEAKTFNTDDAKMLSGDYNNGTLEAKGVYNAAVHPTANAIAKRAFVQHLDDNANLPPEKKKILVTSGGVAAGKGFAISKAGGKTGSLVDDAAAIWDSAGEQYGTENAWVLKEATKRGFTVDYVYVHANPTETWTNPKRGVVERARKKGRMVDSKLFAESYTYGAKNFSEFQSANAGNKSARFHVIDNTQIYNPAKGTGPRLVKKMPKSALTLNPKTLYRRSRKHIEDKKAEIPAYVYRGGTVGDHIWGGKYGASGKYAEILIFFSARDALDRLRLFATPEEPDPLGEDLLDNMRYWYEHWDEFEEREDRRREIIRPVTPVHDTPELNEDGSIKRGDLDTYNA